MLYKMCTTPYRLLLTALIVTTAFGCSGNVKMDTANVTEAEALLAQSATVKPVTINFSSYWEKEQRRDNTRADIEELKQRYIELLTRTVETTLTEQGWSINNEASSSIAVVNVSIDNMRITAPDFRGAQVNLYSKDEHGSGDFSITFEKSGERLAEFKDQRNVMAGAGGNNLTRTSRVINQRAFDRTLQRFIEDALKPGTSAQ